VDKGFRAKWLIVANIKKEHKKAVPPFIHWVPQSGREASHSATTSAEVNKT
jgi:hypothetical protein